MPFDPLYSPAVLSIIATGLLTLALMLCGLFLNGELTRPVVIILGICLICLGACGHIQFIDMQMRGASFIEQNLLSKNVFDDFLKYQAIFIYLFPAVSAAIGTNVISDALLKHQTYQRDFSAFQFIKDCSQIIITPLAFLLALLAAAVIILISPLPFLRRNTLRFLPILSRRTYLKLFKIRIVFRYFFRKNIARREVPPPTKKSPGR